MTTRYVLKDITACTVEEQLAVREIRNQPAVRRLATSDREVSVNEHLAWIARLVDDPGRQVLAVLEGGTTAVGAVDLRGMDEQHRTASWGYFLGEGAHAGHGAAIELWTIEHAFETLGLEKLDCEVLAGHPEVVEAHQAFGFREEGFREAERVKNGERVGVHLLGLTRTAWAEAREGARAKVERDAAGVKVELEQAPPQDPESPLSLIQKARARNNVNWMALLRLSMEHHPHVARPIISEILRLDTEISGLTKRLVEE